MELKDLKAEVYDIMVTMETLQRKLVQLNQQIAAETIEINKLTTDN